jgi:hypothetical protein
MARHRVPLPYAVKIALAEVVVAVIEFAAVVYLLSGIGNGVIR